MPPSPDRDISVSAIVSVYNAEGFIRGALEDLLGQTLYKKGGLEIIVVDTASPQSEGAIVKEYQRLYKNIVYIRTERRATVYSAWNIGINAARGRFITNANSDDRHHPEALERMAYILDSTPDVVLVYSDVFITFKPNETFEEAEKESRYYWYDWDRSMLLEKGCFIGPQPMWRRSVHEEWGYFDESLAVSGDAEFWLRISQNHKFHHFKEPLGLYLKSPSGIEFSNQHRRDFENLRIITAYRRAYKEGKTIRMMPDRRIMDTMDGLISILVTATSDERIEAIKEMITAYTTGDFEIIEIGSKQYETGFVSSLNQALAGSRGSYIAILDDSMVLTDRALNYLVEHLQNNIYVVSPLTNIRVFHEDEPYAELSELRSYAHSLRERNLHRRLSVRKGLASCVIFSSELFSLTGPFDEGYCSLKGAVDDLCLRASSKGARVAIAGDVYVHCSRDTGQDKRDIARFRSKWGSIDPQSDTGRALLIQDAIDSTHQLFYRRSLEKAVETILNYIRIFPQEASLTHCLIKILLQGGRFDDVLGIVSNMKQIDNEIILFKAAALVGLGNLDDAHAAVLGIKEGSSYKANVLGIIAMKRGRYEESEKLFKQAIEMDKSWGEPHRNLGYLQYSRGKKNLGYGYIERGFILQPEDLRCAESYHLVVASEGLYERAEELYKDAVLLHPHCRQPLLFLIDCLIKQDKLTEAMTYIEKLIAGFDYEEQTIEMALKIRRMIGPLDNASADDALSVCMIVRDEEVNIMSCLSSVKPIVDEIVVVDTGSSDKTRELAEIFGARIFYYKWNEDFAAARNESILHAKGRWILILDADEVVSHSDHKLIKGLLKKDRAAYQIVTRNYTFVRSTLGFIANEGSCPEERGEGWTPSMKVRLFKRLEGIRFEGKVHEMVDNSIIRLGLTIETAPFFIHHYGKLDLQRDRIKGERYYQLGIEKLSGSPGDIKAMKELAIVAGGLGKTDESVELWQKVLGSGKYTLEACLNLAGLMISKGDISKALELSRQALQLDPENASARSHISYIEECLRRV